MRSMRSGDKNLIFKYNRGALIEPQLKANQLIFNKESTAQNWNRIPKISGKDQNLFFRLNKTLQPTLRTRVIKDLEPLSRVIGQLPKTQKERQVVAVVTAIEGILTSLKNFMSTPIVDAQGNVVLDPITNKPTVRIRTISELLGVAHAALADVYKRNDVVLSPVYVAVAASFTVDQSIRIIENVRDITKINPTMSSAKRSQVFKNEIIHERLNTDDDIKAGSQLARDTTDAVLENKTNDGDWRGIYPDKWIRPAQWKSMKSNPRIISALKDFIITRESRSNAELTGIGGARLPYPSNQILGVQFGTNNNAFLNLETLQFTSRQNVPADERLLPQPVL